MPLHQFVQRLLLIGAQVESLPPAPAPQAPPALVPLIEAMSPESDQHVDSRPRPACAAVSETAFTDVFGTDATGTPAVVVA